MKKTILCLRLIILTFVLISCFEPTVQPLAPGVPDKIIPTVVRAETLQKIKSMFPEQLNVPLNFPELFKITAEKRIILSKESEVFVTFVSEGASYNNSFGYYTYDSKSVPIDASKLDLKILFPTVDEYKLKQGDMLQIGESKFPAGTVIGFFLIIKGWEEKKVDFTKNKIFTDITLNEDGEQQHILFKFNDFGDIILGFEDIIPSDPRGCDFDYNDIIFTVTDNRNNQEVTTFNLDKVFKF
jgi:hypothetical protein